MTSGEPLLRCRFGAVTCTGRARAAAANERQTRGAKGKREWRGDREREKKRY